METEDGLSQNGIAKGVGEGKRVRRDNQRDVREGRLSREKEQRNAQPISEAGTAIAIAYHDGLIAEHTSTEYYSGSDHKSACADTR